MLHLHRKIVMWAKPTPRSSSALTKSVAQLDSSTANASTPQSPIEMAAGEQFLN
jgi:hypothetical protein